MIAYEEIISIALLTMLTSIIGTLAGFGISTIMIPILLLVLPLPQTLLLVSIVHWFNDIWWSPVKRYGKIKLPDAIIAATALESC